MATINLDLSHLVYGQGKLAVNAIAAGHEARHLAAMATFDLATVTHATAIASPAAGYAGQVDLVHPFTESMGDLTDNELRDWAIMLTVGYIGDPDYPTWPPETMPSILEPKADDEWKVRVLCDRLGLNDDDRLAIWQDVRAKALTLTEDPTSSCSRTPTPGYSKTTANWTGTPSTRSARSSCSEAT
jgi:hypothetical protein